MERSAAPSVVAHVPWSLRADADGFHFSIADASGAGHARHVFVRYLETHGDAASDYDAAELIFGELLANVACHAPGPVDVHVRWLADDAVLTVVDRGDGYRVDGACLPDPLQEHGRGVFVVAELGRDVTVVTRGGTTTTSVRLPVARAL